MIFVYKSMYYVLGYIFLLQSIILFLYNLDLMEGTNHCYASDRDESFITVLCQHNLGLQK